MKKEAFNFDDEDKNSEKKRQNEGLTKKEEKILRVMKRKSFQ